MKKLVCIASCLVSVHCFGGSIPIERAAQFFTPLASPVIVGGWTLLTNITVGSSDGATTTSPAVDTTGATLIVICQSGYIGVNPVSAPTSNPANTWHLGVSNASPGFAYSAMYWATNLTTSASHTFTTPSTALTQPGMTIFVYNGGSGIVDQTNSNKGSSSTLTTGSITPSVDNDLIVAGSAFYSGTTATISSPFSTPVVTGYVSSQHIGVAGSYLFQGLASAINPTYTLSGSSSAAATIMGFKK